MSLSLADVKKHLRLLPNDTSEDTLIEPLITASLEYCEDETGQAFATETIQVTADAALEIQLPRTPVTSVTRVMVGGEETEDYTVDSFDRVTFPEIVEDIVITYTAGMAELPLSIRQAMLLLIAHWYENREAVAIGSIASVQPKLGVAELIRHERRWWF